MSITDELAAALDGHDVTDEEGNISEEETFDSESAPEEQETTEEHDATVESPVEEELEDTQSNNDTNTNDVAEDESGRKYVPQDRFNEIYGNQKRLERENEELRSRNQSAMSSTSKKSNSKPDTKADALEMELLYQKYPEFDPSSGQYSNTLDNLGYKELKADSSITKLEAARRAITTARNLTNAIASERGKVINVKRQQAEGGMTGSSATRVRAESVNPDSMSTDEMEKYLKQSGNW